MMRCVASRPLPRLAALSLPTLTARSLSHQLARQPSPYLHDLVGDESQPGILGGYGVKSVALVDVDAGAVIFREKGALIDLPSMHSIQIGVSQHCQIDGEGRFTAHSFSPNTAVVVAPLCWPSAPCASSTRREEDGAHPARGLAGDFFN